MAYYVYIMTGITDKVLYVGVTNDLARRVHEHKSGIGTGFTARYHLTKLVYFEEYSDINVAIAREKQLKGKTRAKKLELIQEMNHEWRDFGEGLI